MPRPKPTDIQVPPALGKLLRTVLKSRDLSIQDVVEEALTDWLRKHGVAVSHLQTESTITSASREEILWIASFVTEHHKCSTKEIVEGRILALKMKEPDAREYRRVWHRVTRKITLAINEGIIRRDGHTASTRYFPGVKPE
jgi:hypothetical protein